jgi:DnaJ-domain-containing protein 1
MSFTRRIVDQARSGLSSLVESMTSGETSLGQVDERELQAEIDARIAARERSSSKPEDNPRAVLARGGDAARERRRKLAETRRKRIHAARDARAREQKRAHDEAFRRAKEQAAREARARAEQTSSARAGASSTGGARSRPGGGFRSGAFRGRTDPKIARYYKILDLPYGAEFPEVKAAYRKLIRKHHPDRYSGSPQKQKAATELTMQLTQAYNELEVHLTGGRRA